MQQVVVVAADDDLICQLKNVQKMRDKYKKNKTKKQPGSAEQYSVNSKLSLSALLHVTATTTILISGVSQM